MERCPFCLEDLPRTTPRCPFCDEPLTGEGEASLATEADVVHELNIRAAWARSRNTLNYGIAAVLLSWLCCGGAFGAAAIWEGAVALGLWRRVGVEPATRVYVGMALGLVGLGLSLGVLGLLL